MSITYFDHNATTPLDPRVLEHMMPFLTTSYGNPSSPHTLGRQAKHALDQAREAVADLVNAHPTQVIFTSGGTEANNLFLKGVAACLNRSQILYSMAEHPCVARTAQSLAKQGWQIKALPVDSQGILQLPQLVRELNHFTAIVSVLYAHNETGVIQDIEQIVEYSRQQGAWVHTDAVQALGKIPVDFKALGVNGMSLSSHKINGPKGAGALILDKRLELEPILHGGGQERGLRSGTENLAAIVGFGKACELAKQRLNQTKTAHLVELRDHIEQGIKQLGGVIFSEHALRLPNTCFFAFPKIEGETLVIELDKAGFAVASGSACSSAQRKPSQTLLAMGVEPELARGAIRISLGATNTQTEVVSFLQKLEQIMTRLRQFAAFCA